MHYKFYLKQTVKVFIKIKAVLELKQKLRTNTDFSSENIDHIGYILQ